MLIQFDREDSENLVLTFDNSADDSEQMKDFIDWLESSGLEFNKLKMKIPGLADKVTNVFVKKPQNKSNTTSTKKVTSTVVQEFGTTVTPTVTTNPTVLVPLLLEEESDSDVEENMNVAVVDESSESESEDEPVSRTKKTTKRVANSRK
jgi:hypothetical protein